MPVTNRPATGNQSGNQERWNQPSQQHDSSTQGTIQQVKDQAKEAVDSASDLANKAKDKVQEIASNVATQVRDKGQEFANQVKDKGQEFAHTAAERAEDLGVELTAMVRRYPVQALLVGFGIGLLMGRVSRI